ncbi:hypothetical protein EMCG_03961 [[Emmonsia] crescens]|uniref:Uncharacterized protein n=1 Tax=[Emmonsia] crescens TaxID=73230 RepID=A0A0G2HUL7_9EURO|nr:hypothetical protein EMCG_03961 [Emmonsia crescens UAMH 3008]
MVGFVNVAELSANQCVGKPEHRDLRDFRSAPVLRILQKHCHSHSGSVRFRIDIASTPSKKGLTDWKSEKSEKPRSPNSIYSTGPNMSSRPLKRQAFVPYRTRKMKCNRQSPCADCTPWPLECVFPSPIRKCTRSQRKPTSELEEDQSVPVVPQSMVDRTQRVGSMLQEFTSFIKSAHSVSLRSNEFGPPNEVCTQDSEGLAVIEAMAGDIFTKIQSAMRTVTGATPHIS